MTDPALDQLGPVDYAVVEFPAGRLSANRFVILADRAAAG